MEKYNRFIFLIIGIVIGAVISILGIVLLKDKNIDSRITDSTYISNESQGEVGLHEEIVSLNDSQMKELGIVTEEVGPQNLQIYIELTGEIVPNPDQVLHIVPRFAGIVKNVYKEIGDIVKVDEVIAVIESNESLVTYEVKSSMAGVVLDMHMTPGELIGDEKHVVTVTNLSTVWAELNIYQKDLKNIKLGQNADIYFDEKGKTETGKIFYLSPTLDQRTRTGKARVKLNNRTGIWKPGMFITAKVFTNVVNAERAVSLSAIQNFEGNKVVFVESPEGFRPQQITIGKLNSKYAEVLEGLNHGQIYITKGAFTVKAELLKESFGGDHGH